MPSLTFHTYCERRTQLKAAWQDASYSFLRLSPREQLDLHEHYRFTENLSYPILRQHWLDVRAAGSSLPQRAGRSYLAFEQGLLANSHTTSHAPTKPKGRKEERHFRVRGLMRAEPDARKVAKVLLEIAREELRKENKVE